MEKILYDVITVGSNVVDVFIHTNAEETQILKHKIKNGSEELLAYPVGAKILINKLDFHVGGGGTNTAASFSNLGLKTGYLGKIGKDENAEKILEELKKYKVDFLGTRGKTTGYSVILDAKGHDRTILTYKGCNNEFDYPEINLKKLQTKWFYFSSMMSSSLDALINLAIYAKKNNIRLAFNPSEYLVIKGIKKLEPILKNTDLLIFNKEEAFLLSKKKTLKQAFLYLSKYVKEKIIITDGKKGLWLYDKNNKKMTDKIYFVEPNKKLKIVETTGAGDAFASAFTAAIIKQKKVEEALKRGIIQAESVIQAHGAKNKLLSEKEMQASLKKDDRQVKIMDL